MRREEDNEEKRKIHLKIEEAWLASTFFAWFSWIMVVKLSKLMKLKNQKQKSFWALILYIYFAHFLPRVITIYHLIGHGHGHGQPTQL